MSAEDRGRELAREFRSNHRLGEQPLGDLVALIEQAAGIDVAVLDSGPDEHGMAMRDPVRGVVFIGVARTRNPMRQRSTLAHELAHVLFEDWAHNDDNNWSQRSPSEIRADSFARHLLAPVDGVRGLLGTRRPVTLAMLSTVVQRFLVSPQIAAIALEQASCIDGVTKRDWMAQSAPHLAARFGWSDQYEALQAHSDRRRAPQRLLARAIAGYAEGVVPAQAIATLRGVPLGTVVAELEEAGVTPTERPVAWADPADLPDVEVDLDAMDLDLSAEDPPGAEDPD